MSTKDKANPEAKTETAVQENKEVEAAKGMSKIVTVYVVKSELSSVNFPTKARAKAALDLLTMFKVSANIETVKKTIYI